MVLRNPGQAPVLLGTQKFIDEAIIQQKVFTKIHPRPVFYVDKVDYQGMIFMVYEFPVQKYVLPLGVTKNMKGLVPGELYFRKGSGSCQANQQPQLVVRFSVHDQKSMRTKIKG